VSYVPLSKPRFVIDGSGATETIRIKARRQIFALLFLPVWLAGWTAGGIAAITQMIKAFQPFLLIWLCFWVVAWIAVVGTLAWMLFGVETLSVVDRNLEVGIEIGPWKRVKTYDGSQISGLRSASQNFPFASFRFSVPFLRGAQFGAVQFNYGARTVRRASGLDEAEGEMIVERLAKRLPPAAARGRE
jgi:hypothetical protein